MEELTFADRLHNFLSVLPTCILPLLYITAIIAVSLFIGKRLRERGLSKIARGAAQATLTIIAAIAITSMALLLLLTGLQLMLR